MLFRIIVPLKNAKKIILCSAISGTFLDSLNVPKLQFVIMSNGAITIQNKSNFWGIFKNLIKKSYLKIDLLNRCLKIRPSLSQYLTMSKLVNYVCMIALVSILIVTVWPRNYIFQTSPLSISLHYYDTSTDHIGCVKKSVIIAKKWFYIFFYLVYAIRYYTVMWCISLDSVCTLITKSFD